MLHFLLIFAILIGGVKARGEVIYTDSATAVDDSMNEKKYFIAAAESNVKSYSFGEQLANAEQNVIEKIAVNVVDRSFSDAIATFITENQLNPKLFDRIHRAIADFVRTIDHSVLERLDIFQKSEDALWLKVRVDSQKVFKDFINRRRELETRLYKVNLKRKEQYLIVRLVDKIYSVVEANLESEDNVEQIIGNASKAEEMNK